MSAKPTVLVTGASTGIGAVYADRFARRGHSLVLVARDLSRLEHLAHRLRRETGVADRLREDARIGVLVNSAGALVHGTFLDQTGSDLARLIALNVTALTRLANTIAPRIAAAGEGAIINIASIVGLAPEIGLTVYGATKAFVLFLTQGLSVELGPKGVYVQAVLPSVTRTELWERS